MGTVPGMDRKETGWSSRRRRAGDGGAGGGDHGNTGALRWLLTYADMITLLMVFFVVLYAMSRPDAQRYAALRRSLQTAFIGSQAAANSAIRFSHVPVATPKHLPQPSVLTRLARNMESILQHPHVRGATVRLTKEGLDVSFTDRGAFFQKARAQLRPQFRALLTRIAPVLASVPNQIRVEGFTDNEVCNCPKYPTSWSLGAARAVNVTAYLEHGLHLNPRRLAVVSFGQWHPRYPNNSPANMARNRSVDLVVLHRASPGRAP